MSAGELRGRKPRADVQRNRVALLETAQRHFLQHGVGTSLEAVAREAGVGPGTLYRHFPTREALLAAVLQTRSEELVARQADIEQLGDPAEALEQWLRAMEEYFSAFSGLPDPLMAAARAQEPDNPLTIPCDILIAPPISTCEPRSSRGACARRCGGTTSSSRPVPLPGSRAPVPRRSRSTGSACSSRAATASGTPRRKRQTPRPDARKTRWHHHTAITSRCPQGQHNLRRNKS
ncbi:TetR/AcrR family transcriptional regulator [Streptomyces sp. NBC_01483]|uniref:TetR/AcrR family transcriptional regulator n=1 Tax=Streptomyces sp. NBC_01483 TaxID=2903883 RepID=UPI002E36DA8E|nr:TetR/AcrR family transcriptional regulator [Streptomyces sp. NBC_01483]